MTLGVIGEKLGMTQVYDEQGLCIPVTVIKVDPLTVTQVKTVETDGYNAIQVGVVPAKEKHLTKAQIGHFKKNNLENFRHLQEFRVDNPADYQVGQKIDLSVLNEISKVDVSGKSVGKGFKVQLKDTIFQEDLWVTVLKTTENLVQSVQVQLLHVLSKAKEWLVTWVTKELLLLN